MPPIGPRRGRAADACVILLRDISRSHYMISTRCPMTMASGGFRGAENGYRTDATNVGRVRQMKEFQPLEREFGPSQGRITVLDSRRSCPSPRACTGK